MADVDYLGTTTAGSRLNPLDEPRHRHDRNLRRPQDYTKVRPLGSLGLLHQIPGHQRREHAKRRPGHCVGVPMMIYLPTSLHNVPSTATHHNMMLDPAVLCTFF